jgi:hypothetical protein
MSGNLSFFWPLATEEKNAANSCEHSALQLGNALPSGYAEKKPEFPHSFGKQVIGKRIRRFKMGGL